MVGVVLGEHRMTLTGWQYDAEVGAMTALGDSAKHIGWSMHLHPTTVEKRAREPGLPARLIDARLDRIGILIALAGGCIALRGRDRIVVLRLLAASGHDSAEIAKRLRMDKTTTVSKLASNHQIPLVVMNAWQYERDSFRRDHRDDVDAEKLLAA